MPILRGLSRSRCVTVVTDEVLQKTGGVKWHKYQQEKGEILGNTVLK